MDEYPIYPKWRRLLGGLIAIGLGGFAIWRSVGALVGQTSDPVPAWVPLIVLLVGLLIFGVGIGVVFSKRFRPPGAP